MADLNVQRKKKSILPWILLVAGVITLIFFLSRGYLSDNTENNMENNTENNTGIHRDSSEIRP